MGWFWLSHDARVDVAESIYEVGEVIADDSWWLPATSAFV